MRGARSAAEPREGEKETPIRTKNHVRRPRLCLFCGDRVGPIGATGGSPMRWLCVGSCRHGRCADRFIGSFRTGRAGKFPAFLQAQVYRSPTRLSTAATARKTQTRAQFLSRYVGCSESGHSPARNLARSFTRKAERARLDPWRPRRGRARERRGWPPNAGLTCVGASRLIRGPVELQVGTASLFRELRQFSDAVLAACPARGRIASTSIYDSAPYSDISMQQAGGAGPHPSRTSMTVETAAHGRRQDTSRTHHGNQTHLSTLARQTQAHARLSGPHEIPRRPCGAQRASRQGPQAACGLNRTAAARRAPDPTGLRDALSLNRIACV